MVVNVQSPPIALPLVDLLGSRVGHGLIGLIEIALGKSPHLLVDTLRKAIGGIIPIGGLATRDGKAEHAFVNKKTSIDAMPPLTI